jgi:hypothetical protein
MMVVSLGHIPVWRFAGAVPPVVAIATVIVRRSLTCCRTCSSSKAFRSGNQADDDTGAYQRGRLAAFLLLGPCRSERAGVATDVLSPHDAEDHAGAGRGGR